MSQSDRERGEGFEVLQRGIPKTGPSREAYGDWYRKTYVNRSRLITGLALVFAAITVIMAVLGVFYSLTLLPVAVLFGIVTHLLWYHASGRLAERVYRTVETQAAVGGQRSNQEAGFGAGPRDAWQGPRQNRRTAQRQRRARATAGGGGQTRAHELSRREAYRRLNLEPGADEQAIRAAYREKVKDVHPDTEDGTEEAFKRTTEAYERLVES
jgi:hypothetical protein